MELSKEKALYKAAAYCSMAEHCVYEVQQKLERWGASAEVMEEVIAYLKRENYLDESRYCSSFIHDKLHYNKWGRLKMAHALRLKQIKTSFFEPYLLAIDEEIYTTILSELLASKSRAIKARSLYERKGKLIRFAVGRGFEMDKVIALLNHLPDEEDM